MDLWPACRETIHIAPLGGDLLRMVESQQQVATTSLVDDLAEQALLEELIDRSKPPLRSGTGRLHCLLATPSVIQRSAEAHASGRASSRVCSAVRVGSLSALRNRLGGGGNVRTRSTRVIEAGQPSVSCVPVMGLGRVWRQPGNGQEPSSIDRKRVTLQSCLLPPKPPRWVTALDALPPVALGPARGSKQPRAVPEHCSVCDG
jgi:hypothetical protein